MLPAVPTAQAAQVRVAGSMSRGCSHTRLAGVPNAHLLLRLSSHASGVALRRAAAWTGCGVTTVAGSAPVGLRNIEGCRCKEFEGDMAQ